MTTTAKSGERRIVVLGVGVAAVLIVGAVVWGQRAWRWLMNFLGLEYS